MSGIVSLLLTLPMLSMMSQVLAHRASASQPPERRVTE